MDGNQKKCSNCGAPIEGSNAFCTACGNKVTDNTPAASATPADTSFTSPSVNTSEAATPPSATPEATTSTASSTPAEPVFGSNIQLGSSPAASTGYSSSATNNTTVPTGYGSPATGSPAASTGYGSSATSNTTTPVVPPAPPVGNTTSYGQPTSQPAPTAASSMAGPSMGYNNASSAPQPPPPAGGAVYGSQPAQPAAPQYGAQQPGYGAGYSGATPPPPTGAAPYGQPGYPQGGQPGFPVGGPAPTPAKKKSPVVPIVVILLLLVVIVVAVVLFLQQKGIRDEYNQIMENICKADNTSTVVSRAGKLETFTKENPNFSVDADLLTLIAVCEDFEYAGDSEERYTDAIDELKSLEKSSVSQVKACAKNLRAYVEEEYATFTANNSGGGVGVGASGVGGGYDTECPLAIKEVNIFVNNDNKQSFTFASQNNSDKSISYSEFWAFCYDKSGNLVKEGNFPVVWYTLKTTYEPGQSYTIDQFGKYYEFDLPTDIAYVCLVPNYIEFSDGSTWGQYVTNEQLRSGTLPPDVQAYMDWAKSNLADPGAKSALNLSSPVAIPVEKNRYNLLAA